MDKIDIQLIELLQNNSRISITELSYIIKLSRPSVSDRIAKLIDRGILEKFTVNVSPNSVGRKVSFFVTISDLKVPFKKVEEFLLKSDGVTEIHVVTGENNYIVKSSTENIEKMNDFIIKLIPFGRVSTSVILNSPLTNGPVKPI